LAFWAGLFIVGYGFMLEGTTHSLASALAQSAGAVFTVGTVDLSGRANSAIDIAAGATWVVIVALQIAYLPALYQAFNRRESLVAMLESRAGIPAWGPRCWPATNWSASSTPCRTSTPRGRSGPPTWRRATPLTR